MKLGFDAKRIFRNTTGLGNYGRDLVSGLAKFQKEFELHLYHPGSINPQYKSFSESPYHFHTSDSKLSKYWRTKGIVKNLLSDQIDVYHGLSHELPLGIKKAGIPTVVTMHDLIIKRVPETFNRFDRSIYNFKNKQALKQADKVIAISESTRSDLIEIYGVKGKKIVVIPPTINKTFYEPFTEDELEYRTTELGLPKDYLISVGSVIERKNMLRVVEAYSLLPSEDRIPFVILGKGNRYLLQVKKAIEQHQLGQYFIFMDNVEHIKDLKACIQGARGMVYPSIYEGFGIPCVEALALGTPVLSSNISSLPEASGPTSLLVDPYSTEAIADGLQSILSSDHANESLVKQGKVHADQFRQEVLAEKVASLYRSLK